MSVIISGITPINAEVDISSSALRAIYIDSTGAPIGPRATYDAATNPYSPPATPTDVFSIYSSPTKTVRVTRIRLYNSSLSASVNSWFLVKRSTFNNGGTQISCSLVPRDSNNAAATNQVIYYTTNPTTTGNSLGNVRTAKVLSTNTGSNVFFTSSGLFNQSIDWDFDDGQSSPEILRKGSNEMLSINFGGAALPAALSLHCNITWTED